MRLGGALLVNIGTGPIRPRWTVSLGALRAAAAGWFTDGDELREKIDWLAEHLDETREGLATQSRRIALVHEATMAVAREFAKQTGRPRLALVPNARRARDGGAA